MESSITENICQKKNISDGGVCAKKRMEYLL